MVFEVTVLVCTYNSDINKTIYTLNSIIMQENINIQIIVADDGSIDNHFDIIDSFFDKQKFTDYMLVSSENNKGTVNSILHVLPKASGAYIKLISPGDYLYSKGILREWLDFMKKKSVKNSFGEAVFYKNDSCFSIIRNKKSPILTSVYKKNDQKRIKRNYLVVGDAILGASLLTERGLLYEYLLIIKNRVRLCEDYSYMLMALNNEHIACFDKTVIWYEYGLGVSTSDGAKKRLLNDWLGFNKMLVEMDPVDSFMRKYCRYMTLMLKHYDLPIYRRIVRLGFYPSFLFVRSLMKIVIKKRKQLNVDMDYYNAVTSCRLDY